jgi:hypothetical protein
MAWYSAAPIYAIERGYPSPVCQTDQALTGRRFRSRKLQSALCTQGFGLGLRNEMREFVTLFFSKGIISRPIALIWF